MSQYLETGGNILLMGPSGAGKTRLIQDLMKKVGAYTWYFFSEMNV